VHTPHHPWPAAIAAAAALAATAASAQPATSHRLGGESKSTRTCPGSGPLARPVEFMSYRNDQATRSPATTICSRVLED
jgi:hypothetical protein